MCHYCLRAPYVTERISYPNQAGRYRAWNRRWIWGWQALQPLTDIFQFLSVKIEDGSDLVDQGD